MIYTQMELKPNMTTSAKELNAVLVGSKSSRKYLVGNIVLGRQAFDPRDVTSHCERGEGEVCGRTVKLVKAPGWLRGDALCNTPELFKTEAILSVTLCPPELHGFLLVIDAELPFKNEHEKATREHLQHFFGEKVWDHTMVVFSHRGDLRHKTIEDYITREGAPLQSLLKACSNRYHVLCDDGKDNDVKVKELFEKIDAMMAKNRCYEADGTLMKSVDLKRKIVAKKAEDLRLQSLKQREKLRKLLTEPTPILRILMVGWMFSGKSATGNNILKAEPFQSGDRTHKAFQQSGEVAGRKVIIVDTPGWWRFSQPVFHSLFLKFEILEGVSLCSPSPNVILLVVPLDTSFTDEQRRVTECNMKLLGERVWRYLIVLFTFGDTLGDKTVEQHIESEGKPLHWLMEKCGNRYHVLNNTIAADDQVTELLQKMEEMIAGNSFFYLGAHPEKDDPQPQEDRCDVSTEKKDENTTKEITEQLFVPPQNIQGNGSMRSPPKMSDDKQKSEGSDGEEEQEQRHEDDQLKTYFLAREGDERSEPMKRWMEQLEKEWSRREATMEQMTNKDRKASSEPDLDQLITSSEKVTTWLNTRHTSGYGTASVTTSITSWKSEEDIYRQTVGKHSTGN